MKESEREVGELVKKDDDDDDDNDEGEWMRWGLWFIDFDLRVNFLNLLGLLSWMVQTHQIPMQNTIQRLKAMPFHLSPFIPTLIFQQKAKFESSIIMGEFIL